MAAQNSSEQPVPMDQKAHVATYGGFLKMLKWGTILAVLAAAFVVVLIAS